MSLNRRIHIVISDQGWILEACAREIATRLDGVTYSLESDYSADLQYYITYSKFSERRCPIEVGFFTHLEQDPVTRERFFNAAIHMDHCVTMARLYEQALREAGIQSVSTISPGVDLSLYQPRLRIGVVGRTYASGRKGEALLAEVMDIPEIEWRFTGEGWPGPADYIPAERMPEFYHGLDYVLVPSLYEGGPMCVLEALACGRQVIAPEVGFVPDYPHIPFRTGDAVDLRRVLLELVDARKTLRQEVEHRGWDAWAAGHQTLFERLFRLHRDRLGAGPVAVDWSGEPPVKLPRVAFGLHGPETREGAQGGPSVRVPRTIRELRLRGFDAMLCKNTWPAANTFDVAHVFNVSTFETALDLIEAGRQAQKPIVFSPIFLDQSEWALYTQQLPALFRATPAAELAAALEQLRATQSVDSGRAAFYSSNAHRQASMIREMIEKSDHVILLSEHERHLLELLGASPGKTTLIHNPVDVDQFAGVNGRLFRETYGLEEYVLCVARIEPRKNQLMLAYALRELGMPVVLLGHVEDEDYLALIQQFGGDKLRIINRLPPGSDLLKSAYLGARVCVLPSWAEGAPLSALEAAAAGARLVLSNRSAEQEYFGSRARYCDPLDAASIRTAVQAAWDEPADDVQRLAQIEWVREQYGWDRYVNELARLYAEVAQDTERELEIRRTAQQPRIYVDLSTSAHTDGQPVGTMRVESKLAQGLAALMKSRVHFAVWNVHYNLLLALPTRRPTLDQLRMHARTEAIGASAEPIAPRPGDILLIAGNAWIGQAAYVRAVMQACLESGMELWLFVHDLIHLKFPQWEKAENVTTFERNLHLLLNHAQRVLVYSECTRRDLMEYVAQHKIKLRIDRVTLGADAIPASQEDRVDAVAAVRNPYVLYVSTIAPRKNHALLLAVWRRLASEMGTRTPVLIFVGRVAQDCAAMVDTVQRDPLLKPYVQVRSNVGDLELGALYRDCAFTVFPSFYEGWGIPIAESLAYGKPCLAASSGSIPEISPLLKLLPPEDIEGWFRCVRRWILYPGEVELLSQQIREQYTPASWDDTVRMTADLLCEPLLHGSGKPVRQDQQILDFKQTKISRAYLREGWSYLENWGCWTQADEARLVLPCPMQQGDLLLEFEHRVRVHEKQPRLSVGVIVNGQELDCWTFAHPLWPRDRRARIIVPQAVHQCQGVLNLRLKIDGASSPKDQGLSADARCLGYGIERVTIRSLLLGEQKLVALQNTTRIANGAVFNYQADTNGLGTLISGWGRQEKWGTWSIAKRAQLVLRPMTSLRHRLLLRVLLRAFVRPEFPRLLVHVYANGIKVDHWVFQNETHLGDHERELIIPARAFQQSRELRLVFECVNVRSPKELGLGQDGRMLGIGLIHLAAWDLGVADSLVPPCSASDIELDRQYQLNDTVELDETDDPEMYLIDGWQFEEEAELHGEVAAGWKMKVRGRILLACNTLPDGSGQFTATVVPWFAPGDASMTVRLLVNGLDSGSHELDAGLHGAPCVLDWMVSAALLHGARKQELELRLEPSAGTSWSLPEFPIALGAEADQPCERGLSLRRMILHGPNCQLGETIHFQELAPTSSFLCEGWGEAESWGYWSVARKASMLVFPAEFEESELQLVFMLRAFVNKLQVQFSCLVRVNGRELTSWTFVYGEDIDEVERVVDIPRDLFSNGQPLKIEFAMPGVQSPEELGLNADPRQLGIGLRSFQLRDTKALDSPLDVNLRINEPFILAKNPVARTWLRSGWGLIESWGCWTVASVARMMLVVDQLPQDDLPLAIRMRAHVGGLQPQLPVRIVAGGREIVCWTLEEHRDEDYHERRLLIPAAVWQGRKWVELTWELPGVRSPFEMGMREDARKLGVGLVSLRILTSAEFADQQTG